MGNKIQYTNPRRLISIAIDAEVLAKIDSSNKNRTTIINQLLADHVSDERISVKEGITQELLQAYCDVHEIAFMNQKAFTINKTRDRTTEEMFAHNAFYEKVKNFMLDMEAK